MQAAGDGRIGMAGTNSNHMQLQVVGSGRLAAGRTGLGSASDIDKFACDRGVCGLALAWAEAWDRVVVG